MKRYSIMLVRLRSQHSTSTLHGFQTFFINQNETCDNDKRQLLALLFLFFVHSYCTVKHKTCLCFFFLYKLILTINIQLNYIWVTNLIKKIN